MAKRALSWFVVGITCSLAACSSSDSKSGDSVALGGSNQTSGGVASAADPIPTSGAGGSIQASAGAGGGSPASNGSSQGGGGASSASAARASSAAGGASSGASYSSPVPPPVVSPGGGAGGARSGSAAIGAGGKTAGASASAAGGAGGGTAKGGATAMGGAMGGSVARGGTTSAGGATAMGGTSVAGGATAVGGASTASSTVPIATNVNPFVMTKHDPFSTFGADVDTASYDVFRQYAQMSKLPPRAGVRTEEYVNFFSYDYPGPGSEGPHPFYISLAAANNMFDRNTTLLRVGIQAAKPPAETAKKPTNLVFLLDVSGSMDDPKKLPLVQTMMKDALDQLLEPTDTVAVVTYSTSATVNLKPTPVSQRDTIVSVIDKLAASGSTAGADGIGLAYQQAAAGFIQGGINHIVMCTDGDFNVGPSSTSELLALIKSKRSTGVTLTVLGFGIGNLNDSMMESIADAGNGIYSVISDEDHALQYVKTKMLSTVVHVAKDMKIQVEFSPEYVQAYRLLGYEDRDIADSNFRNDTVDGGEVGAGHRVTALYELVLTGQKIPNLPGMPLLDDGVASTLKPEILNGDAVLVKVRYKDVDATDATPAKEVSTALATTAFSADLGVADQDMRWAVAVAALAEILKGSPYGNRGFLANIESIANAQATRDADRTEFVALLTKIIPLL